MAVEARLSCGPIVLFIGKMSDVEYQKKLKDLQKYVPFLENTISKLKRETEKSREPQVAKLQSLLEILTDTKRK